MRKDWFNTTLDGIAEVVMGQSPDGKTYNLEGKGLPFMQGSAEFGEHNPVPEKWCSDPKKIAEPGDLLLSVRAPVGDTNFADQRIAVGRGLSIIRANKESLTEFIRLVIQLNVAELIASSGSGMFASITGKNLKEFKVNLPPLPEQKRIVDLISSVDSYIEALQQQLESAKKSRNAVLHELLTARDDEWVETSLGDIADWGSGGTPKADNAEYYGGAIPWCVIGDLTEGEVWETEKKISQLGLTNSSAKIIDPGSVLLAMYGASIGRTGISAIPMATNQAIAFAKCKEEMVLPKYLLVYLQTQKSKFIEMGQGAAQPNISQTIIRTWPISLPPIVQQKKVIERIESFSKLIESTDLLVNKTKNLRYSLLSDLLSGEHEIPASYDKVMGAA